MAVAWSKVEEIADCTDGRVLIRLLFGNIHANHRSFVILSTASAQPLGQRGNRPRGVDLPNELDVTHVYSHLQGARAERGCGHAPISGPLPSLPARSWTGSHGGR